MTKLVIAAQQTARYFPEDVMDRFRALGTVIENKLPRPLKKDELAERIGDAEILVTHWGSPKADAELLERAPKLRLIAHCAGSVSGVASEEAYARGIRVVSANAVMAKYVAEAVLGYLIAGTHCMVQLDGIVRAGGWDKLEDRQISLYGAEIGMIGLGTVGRYLLKLLAPFGCRVHVYDPYITEGALAEYPFARLCDFETAMRCGIVTVHAAKTKETFHMIDAAALRMIPDGGVFVNTSRGSLVDTGALIAELQTGRIRAVLDVYEEEGAGKLPGELLSLRENTLLLPHTAASAVGKEMSVAVAEDIGRFLRGEPPELEIPERQYRLMTLM